MKSTLLLAMIAAMVMICVPVVSAQQAQMPPPAPGPIYDNQYAGPYNVYGQPTFIPPQSRGQAGPQNPGQFQGLFPMAAQGAQSMGSYFWSYMPAPMRGAETQFVGPPGSGQVIINYVPGGTP